MKSSNVDKKLQKKFSATKTFYNYRNNDFQRVNSYLTQDQPIKTTPDDLRLDDETAMKILKNNQEISGNLNSKKFTQERRQDFGYVRHSSTPLVSPLDIAKVKQSIKVNELPLSPFSQEAIKKTTPITNKSHFTLSQTIHTMPSTEAQVNSARTHRALPTLTDSYNFSEKARVNSPRSIFNMTHQEIQDLSKKLIARDKLTHDRAQSFSQMEKRIDQKRDISHFSDSRKSIINQPRSAIGTLPGTPVRYELNLDKLKPLTPNIDQMGTIIDTISSTDKTPPPHNIVRNDLALEETTRSFDGVENVRRLDLTRASRFSKEGGGMEIGKTNSSPNAFSRIVSQVGIVSSPTGQRPLMLPIPLSKLSPKSRNLVSPDTSIFIQKQMETPRGKIISPELKSPIRRLDMQDDLLGELRVKLPNTMTSAPVSRQDVVVLSSWTDGKIQEIMENVLLTTNEKTAMCEKVYNLCMTEVFRQVSLDCVERGELLQKVWDYRSKNFRQSLDQADTEKKTLIDLNQEENQKQYEWYQQLINKRDKDLEECKFELKKAVDEKMEAEENLKKIFERNTKYKQREIEVKRVMKKLKAQMEELKEENARYAKRLAYKIANTNKGTYVPTFLSYNASAPKDSNVRDASLPANLGLGSSLSPVRRDPSIKNLNPDLKESLIKVTDTQQTQPTQEEESMSVGTVESSFDFVYEDEETKAKQVFRIDQLNSNAVAYKKGKSTDLDNPNNIKYIATETCESGVQTNLALTSIKFDDILSDQKMLEELIMEVQLKKQVDILADDNYFPSLDFSKLFEGIDLKESKIFKKSLAGESKVIEDKIDGLATPNGQAERMKSPLDENMLSPKGLTPHIDLGLIATTPTQQNTQSKREEFHQIMKKILEGEAQEAKIPGIRIIGTNGQGGQEEKEAVVSENKVQPLKVSNTPKMQMQNPNYLLWAEPIQELNEISKSYTRSQFKLDDEEEGVEQLKQEESRSIDEKELVVLSSKVLGSRNLSKRSVSPIQSPEPEDGKEAEEEKFSVDEDLLQTEREEDHQEEELEGDEEEGEEILLETENNSPEIRRESVIQDSNRNSPRQNNGSSFETDDPFRSLENVASDNASSVKGRRHSLMEGDSIVSRMNKDEGRRTISHQNSLDENLQTDTERSVHGDGQLRSLENLAKPAISLSTLVNTKAKVSQLVSMFHAKREDAGVVDKARMFLVLRMYRVEKEKTKLLKNSISELEEQIINEKQHQIKLQENVTEMKEHITLLSQIKAKCPHGRCAICNGEKEMDDNGKEKGGMEMAEVKEIEEDEENNENYTAGELDDEDDGQDEFDGDEAEEEEEMESQPGFVRKISKGRKSKKRLTAGVNVEMVKKSKKEQVVSAAFAIIAKIKDKKLAKFRNFMPMKSVLKQIHSLYTERIVHTKENSIWKEEEFCAFAYKVFSSNFGFRKIAEQKFIIFLLSVKKYLHVVRINLFARFMGLLTGPSNFSVDEFNKYLEGIEFINNSTLGINMVNLETDSKFYAPFLRGLEYLRFFSENKMAMEEYVEFKREFDAIKVNDPKNINRNGIVDVDLFMTKILTKYRVIMSRTKQFVVNAFKAADLDGNKYCSLKEFIMIYRNIESDKFDEGFAENLFLENADIKIEGEVNLSFDKFTVVCVEYGLFSDTQQDQFLEIANSSEIEGKIITMKVNWETRYQSIDTKLSESSKVTQEERDYWLSILKVLDDRIANFEQVDPADYKPLLIAWKILDQEVERLRENEIEVDEYGVRRLTIIPKIDHQISGLSNTNTNSETVI